jgi:hypothetical protein
MRSGKYRKYHRPPEPEPADEIEGFWPLEQLIEMDQRFQIALRRQLRLRENTRGEGACPVTISEKGVVPLPAPSAPGVHKTLRR